MTRTNRALTWIGLIFVFGGAVTLNLGIIFAGLIVLLVGWTVMDR